MWTVAAVGGGALAECLLSLYVYRHLKLSFGMHAGDAGAFGVFRVWSRSQVTRWQLSGWCPILEQLAAGIMTRLW